MFFSGRGRHVFSGGVSGNTWAHLGPSGLWCHGLARTQSRKHIANCISSNGHRAFARHTIEECVTAGRVIKLNAVVSHNVRSVLCETDAGNAGVLVATKQKRGEFGALKGRRVRNALCYLLDKNQICLREGIFWAGSSVQEIGCKHGHDGGWGVGRGRRGGFVTTC